MQCRFAVFQRPLLEIVLDAFLGSLRQLFLHALPVFFSIICVRPASRQVSLVLLNLLLIAFEFLLLLVTLFAQLTLFFLLSHVDFLAILKFIFFLLLLFDLFVKNRFLFFDLFADFFIFMLVVCLFLLLKLRDLFELLLTALFLLFEQRII